MREKRHVNNEAQQKEHPDSRVNILLEAKAEKSEWWNF